MIISDNLGKFPKGRRVIVTQDVRDDNSYDVLPKGSRGIVTYDGGDLISVNFPARISRWFPDGEFWNLTPDDLQLEEE